MTGTFRGTFHATDEPQLDKVAALAGAVSPELVAKTAVYCRKHGRMKDVPAFLVAWLAARDVGLMLRVFPHVIDDARMLRSFVAIVRSGVTGRRSFGSAPKRALREWFAARSPETIFRQSIGQSPSVSDVIKMVRPPPRNDKGEADAVREALYGYLIGKNVDCSKLPPLPQAFEASEEERPGAFAGRAVRDAHRTFAARRALDRAGEEDVALRARATAARLVRVRSRAAPYPRPVASSGACGDGSRVEPERAKLEIRVRVSVTAPACARVVSTCRAQASLRSPAEGAPHERGSGSSTLPAATARPRSREAEGA